LYDGPIIDAHHHLWDLGLGRHRWLTEDDAGLAALGDISYMRHTYLPADYLRDVATTKVVASVHIEAVWDRARSPVEETAWLETLDKTRGVATRYVAYAPLRAPDAAAVIAAQAACPRVVAVRETIRWHPDPAKRWSEAGLVDDPAFRRGVALLGRNDLALELLMNPYQAEDVARLAAEFPSQLFIVNHCGTPVDRDAEGLAHWRNGLARMGKRDNIAIKISNFGAYSADKSLPQLRETVMTCIDAFGTARSMFGTDYPVARRHMTYAAMVDAFTAIIAGFSPAEQRALFHDNATRCYRFAA
jgi:predicted TIM-barrel fold metal-dependent hydrolase